MRPWTLLSTIPLPLPRRAAWRGACDARRPALFPRVSWPSARSPQHVVALARGGSARGSAGLYSYAAMCCVGGRLCGRPKRPNATDPHTNCPLKARAPLPESSDWTRPLRWPLDYSASLVILRADVLHPPPPLYSVSPRQAKGRRSAACGPRPSQPHPLFKPPTPRGRPSPPRRPASSASYSRQRALAAASGSSPSPSRSGTRPPPPSSSRSSSRRRWFGPGPAAAAAAAGRRRRLSSSASAERPERGRKAAAAAAWSTRRRRQPRRRRRRC